MKQFAGKLPLTTAAYGQFGNRVDGEVRAELGDLCWLRSYQVTMCALCRCGQSL